MRVDRKDHRSVGQSRVFVRCRCCHGSVRRRPWPGSRSGFAFCRDEVEVDGSAELAFADQFCGGVCPARSVSTARGQLMNTGDCEKWCEREKEKEKYIENVRLFGRSDDGRRRRIGERTGRSSRTRGNRFHGSPIKLLTDLMETAINIHTGTFSPEADVIIQTSPAVLLLALSATSASITLGFWFVLDTRSTLLLAR